MINELGQLAGNKAFTGVVGLPGANVLEDHDGVFRKILIV